MQRYVLLLKVNNNCLCIFDKLLTFLLDILPSSVAVGEDRCAPGVQEHPSSAAGGKIILGADALCGIFPPLRRRRAPAFLPEATDPFGNKPS